MPCLYGAVKEHNHIAKKKSKINPYAKKEKKPCTTHKWGAKSFGGRRVCDVCGKVETF